MAHHAFSAHAHLWTFQRRLDILLPWLRAVVLHGNAGECTAMRRSRADPPIRARPYDFCKVSPPAPPQTGACVGVRNACFDAEQIFMHGPDAQQHRDAIHELLLRAKDLYDVKRSLRPNVHNTTHVADAGAPYGYLPLAVNAQRAETWRNRSNDTSAYQQRLQPLAPSEWIENSTAVAFFTTFSSSFTETFSRATVQLFEQYCAHRGTIDVIPAAFGSPKPDGNDHAATYLAPLTRTGHIEPMSLTPQPERLQQAIFGNFPTSPGRARHPHCPGNGTCLEAYLAQSERYFAAIGQRCFRSATVCNFARQPTKPGSARPWSLMQALATHHAGPPPSRATSMSRMLSCGDGLLEQQRGEGPVEPAVARAARAAERAGRGGERCPLRVVFIQREGRRRLLNIDEHVAACNAWRSTRGVDDPTPSCEAYTFRRGLAAALPLLRRTDVLIGPHGADMTNALALHAGATVVELLPPIASGCPCAMYQQQFAVEPSVLHYTASTRNVSRAARTGLPRFWNTYHSDFVTPVEVTRRILSHVVDVGGRLERFRPLDFEY